jgi:hypothetical protein
MSPVAVSLIGFIALVAAASAAHFLECAARLRKAARR